MLGHLAAGDLLTVTRIDRLARSTFDLFGIVKQIVDAGAHFRSLAEPWADTGTSTGRLMIAVLGGLADVPSIRKAQSPTVAYGALTFLIGGGFQVPSRIEGGVSFGQ